MPADTVVYIHGMFMTSRCWEDWIPFTEARGFRVEAPGWPGRDKPVEALRQEHPNRGLARMGLSHVMRHYERIVSAMQKPPILIGHSMGGLVVQKLLNRGLGAAGVAVNSAPPVGAFTLKWSFLRCNLPLMNFFANGMPLVEAFSTFQYAFVNGMPLEKQQAIYDRQAVPESRRVAQQSLGPAGFIHFRTPRAPLLLVAGGNDHIIPASLNRMNARLYAKSAGVTDFKEFPGRTHYVIGQDGWEDVAAYALDWAARNSG